MGLLTAEQDEWEENFYGSQIYSGDEVASKSMFLVPGPSPASSQRKRQYEALTREKEKYLVNHWLDYYDHIESRD